MPISLFADKEKPPAMEELFAAIGDKALLWENIAVFMRESYGAEGELKFYGKNYGWIVQLKKGSRTLLSLYPTAGGIKAQIILPVSALEKLQFVELLDRTNEAIEAAKCYREGAWVYLDLFTAADAIDVKRLVMLKHPLKMEY